MTLSFKKSEGPPGKVRPAKVQRIQRVDSRIENRLTKDHQKIRIRLLDPTLMD
jgi:hypothetical protein